MLRRSVSPAPTEVEPGHWSIAWPTREGTALNWRRIGAFALQALALAALVAAFLWGIPEALLGAWCPLCPRLVWVRPWAPVPDPADHAEVCADCMERELELLGRDPAGAS